MRFIAVFAAVCIAAMSMPALAFDSDAIRAKIYQAMKRPPAIAIAGAPPAAPDPDALQTDRLSRLRAEQDASYDLLATCEGRFNALRTTLKKQVSRAEWISGTGGLIGVLGTVATCPHCAALAAGVAGLANPLQQTFRDNFDSPQDTQDVLNKLSAKIDAEIQSYTALPPADIEIPSSFEGNLRRRLDALMVITASCAFYSSTLQASK